MDHAMYGVGRLIPALPLFGFNVVDVRHVDANMQVAAPTTERMGPPGHRLLIGAGQRTPIGAVTHCDDWSGRGQNLTRRTAGVDV
jgi:hypothetical protein